MRWRTLLTSCQEVQCLLSCSWPSKLNYLVKALEFHGVRCIFSFVPLKLWASCFLITTHSMVQHPRIVLAWISYILRSWNAGLLPFNYFADIILQVNQTVNYQLSCLDRVREFYLLCLFFRRFYELGKRSMLFSLFLWWYSQVLSSGTLRNLPGKKTVAITTAT